MIKINHALCKKLAKYAFLFVAAFLAGHFAARIVDSTVSTSIQSSAEGNWGLSFQEEGKPPVANATFDELKKFLPAE